MASTTLMATAFGALGGEVRCGASRGASRGASQGATLLGNHRLGGIDPASLGASHLVEVALREMPALRVARVLREAGASRGATHLVQARRDMQPWLPRARSRRRVCCRQEVPALREVPPTSRSPR
jgi:hypothetical protein